MQYDAGFGVYREDREPISDEVLTRLIRGWVVLVEKEDLCTLGGIKELTLLDVLLTRAWIFLWRFTWLRRIA